MLKVWESGEPSVLEILLIHGWTCTHETMQPLVERFQSNYHCISLDLLGHGESPHSKTDYAIATQADAIIQTLGADRMGTMLLVGHSMGGQIALELAARGLSKAAVLLDPAHILPHASALKWGQGTAEQLAKVDIPAMMQAFARNQFIGPVDPELVEQLVDTMASTDPQVTRAAWEGVLGFDGAGALANLSRHTLVISGNKPLNPPTDLIRASKCIETAQTAVCGHMQPLEVPDQLEVMIRRFIAQYCCND